MYLYAYLYRYVYVLNIYMDLRTKWTSSYIACQYLNLNEDLLEH